MATRNEQLEKPTWVNFFDGELFRRYQDFARTRDFSQVLATLREGITYKENPKWPPQEITLAQSVQTIDLSNFEMGDNSDAYSAKYTTDSLDFSAAEWRKQRKKRTRTYVLLGILLLCLVALLAALVMHFHLATDLFGNETSVTVPRSLTTSLPAPLRAIFTPRASQFIIAPSTAKPTEPSATEDTERMTPSAV